MAVQVALAGDWHGAHQIAQKYHDPIASWLHAVLHKMEGDVGNSHYWYAKTSGKSYAQFADAREELQAIVRHLER
ncbi:MAG: hypothetical protein EXR38_03930 [Methylotenera sp.]|nr:hypothetical protein [Methylotenera sp.]MSP99635.1 hypothetical protein [Methylotenera sp.]